MTTKTIKAALFAALVFTLMIPISGTNRTEALSINNVDDVKTKTFDADIFRKVLDAKEKETTQKLENAKAKDLQKEEKALEDILKRISILKQLVNIKEQIESSNDDQQIASLDEQARNLLSDLESTYPQESKEVARSLDNGAVTLTAPHIVGWATSVSRSPDCYNPNTTFGTNQGSGTSDATGTTINLLTVSYPLKIGQGVVGNCSVKNGSYTYDTLNGLTGFCYITYYTVSGTTYNLNCSGVKWNDVVAVTTQAYYSGGNTFSTAGWTLMLT